MPLLQDYIDGLRRPGGLSEDERADAAKDLIEKCGYAAAALTIIPIPFSAVVGVTSVHVAMVVGVGRIYGAEVSRDAAGELVLRIGATAGLSLVGSRVALGIAKAIFPVAPGLLGAPFMYASTLGIGTVARAYFESQGAISDDEIRAVYKEAMKEARGQFDPRKVRSGQAQAMAKEAAHDDAPAPQEDRAAPPSPTDSEAAAPPGAAEPTAEDPITQLERLKELRDKGLIEPEEFDRAKREILDTL